MSASEGEKAGHHQMIKGGRLRPQHRVLYIPGNQVHFHSKAIGFGGAVCKAILRICRWDHASMGIYIKLVPDNSGSKMKERFKYMYVILSSRS